MLHKAPRKRKIRSVLKLIFVFLCLFFGSFLCLLAAYFLLIRTPQIFSPISIKSHSKGVFALQGENEQKIKNSLTKYAIPFSSISSSYDSYTIVLKYGEEIIFSAKKDIEQQTASLQLIMKHFTIEGKLFKRIDFIFDNPVVTF